MSLREKPELLTYLAAPTQCKSVQQAASDTGVRCNKSFSRRHPFLYWNNKDFTRLLHGFKETVESCIYKSNKGLKKLKIKVRMRDSYHACNPGIFDQQKCILPTRVHSGQTLDFALVNKSLTTPPDGRLNLAETRYRGVLGQ